MKRKYYIKNKLFFRNFCILMAILLTISVLVTAAVYRMSSRALQQEITGMQETVTSELTKRVEEILLKGNRITVDLALDEMIQLYFACENPEKLVKDYYDDITDKLSIQGMDYIDSIILYAPEYERVFDSSWDGNFSYADEEVPEELLWMEEFKDNLDIKKIYTRAQADGWPYYITLVRSWSSKTAEGFIFLNIDIEKLYDELIAGRNDALQLYLVDDKQRVILKDDKEALYTPIEDIVGLDLYQKGKSFSEIQMYGKSTYTYAQVSSDEYDFTSVTITPVGDYFVRISQVQKQFIFALCLAIGVATVLACIYSIKLVKPQEESSQLRQELVQRTDLLKDTQLLALQTQINPHFMFNTLNIASLMIESDCGDGHPVSQILGGLSDILRYSLSKAKTALIKEEITYVEKYLAIMEYRYGEFEVELNVDEKIYDYMIPKLTLQPLVENALQHGLVPCFGIRPGKIIIQAEEVMHTYENGKELASVCIDIIDTGLGMDEEKLKELRDSITDHYHIPADHIGVFNVAQRVWLLFHEEQKVTIDSTFGKGTHIQLVFPAKK